jgi:hypothetical protein
VNFFLVRRRGDKENLTIKVSAALITSVSPFTPLQGGNPLLGHQPSSG